MNRESYIKVMRAIAHLIIVIMQEAGKTPFLSAKKIADAFLNATVGKTTENEEDSKKTDKK